MKKSKLPYAEKIYFEAIVEGKLQRHRGYVRGMAGKHVLVEREGLTHYCVKPSQVHRIRRKK